MRVLQRPKQVMEWLALADVSVFWTPLMELMDKHVSVVSCSGACLAHACGAVCIWRLFQVAPQEPPSCPFFPLPSRG